jgi:hypothetical protein
MIFSVNSGSALLQRSTALSPQGIKMLPVSILGGMPTAFSLVSGACGEFQSRRAEAAYSMSQDHVKRD